MFSLTTAVLEISASVSFLPHWLGAKFVTGCQRYQHHHLPVVTPLRYARIM